MDMLAMKVLALWFLAAVVMGLALGATIRWAPSIRKD
jgi:hypothetical protein